MAGSLLCGRVGLLLRTVVAIRVAAIVLHVGFVFHRLPDLPVDVFADDSDLRDQEDDPLGAAVYLDELLVHDDLYRLEDVELLDALVLDHLPGRAGEN